MFVATKQARVAVTVSPEVAVMLDQLAMVRTAGVRSKAVEWSIRLAHDVFNDPKLRERLLTGPEAALAAFVAAHGGR